MKFSLHGRLAVIGALYLAGLGAWGYFLNWGGFPYDFHDWAEVNMPRLAVVQDALRNNTLPLHANQPAILRCGMDCDRYFSSVDAIASPDLLLLKWLPLTTWALAHWLLLYSLGFLGLLAIRRRFGLSLPLFVCAFLLFNFNGHLVAHLSVGHLTWGGVFLLPWLAVLVDQFIRGEDSWGWALKVTALLAGMLIQGAFHQFVWAYILFGVLGLVYCRRALMVVKALFFTALVSAARILPPLLALNHFDRDFYGGYPNLWAVYAALTRWIPPERSMPFAVFGYPLGYWEYDLYIGKAGFYFLFLVGLAWIAVQVKEKRFERILIPIAALFALSLDGAANLVHELKIPLFAGERVMTRILSMAFIFFLFFGLAGLQRLVNGLGRWKFAALGVILAASGWLAIPLWQMLHGWRISAAALAFPVTPVILAGYRAANHADPPYLAALAGGGLISGLALAFLIVKAGSERHAARRAAQTQPSGD